MNKKNFHSNEIEIVLAEATAPDLVRAINALTAQYRKDYYLSDIYLYNGKGKVTFIEKPKKVA